MKSRLHSIKGSNLFKQLQNEYPLSARAAEEHIKLATCINSNFPQLSIGESEQIAIQIIEEVIDRYSQGENIAFYRTDTNGDMILTPFAVAFINNKVNQ